MIQGLYSQYFDSWIDQAFQSSSWSCEDSPSLSFQDPVTTIKEKYKLLPQDEKVTRYVKSATEFRHINLGLMPKSLNLATRHFKLHKVVWIKILWQRF